MTIAEFAGIARVGAAGRAAIISQALLSRGRSVVEQIFGAGLGVPPTNGGTIAPFVLADSRIADRHLGEVRFVNDEPAVRAIVAGALGLPISEAGDFIGETRVYYLPPPDLHLSPGDSIARPAVGRIGCPATWSSGAGFITAGHVSGAAGGTVHDGSMSHLGTVRQHSYPAGGGAAPMADYGLVELASGLALTAAFAGTSAAGPNAIVEVHKGATVTGQVMGFCAYVHLPSIGGTYGDTYFTTAGLTVPGDSGSAVTIGKAVAGIVVAGTPAYTTYFQDIRYLLACAAPGGSVSGLTV